jgi:hypothetical protein
MIENLHRLALTCRDVEAHEAESNIFESISDTFYRENFHSDLIAYYLRIEVARRYFLQFLNRVGKTPQPSSPQINIDDYLGGIVVREDGRLDITIFNNNGQKAIVIENKSNDAQDMPEQLVRYLNSLENRHIDVERIVYLRRNHLGGPDKSQWAESDIRRVSEKLIPMQFFGQNGFCNEIIDGVLRESTDVRTNGLSLEIKAFFSSLAFGGTNMENIKEFVKELRKGTTLAELKQAISAYNNLPSYWVAFFEAYLKQKFESENFHKWHIGLWGSACVYVDRISVNKRNFGFDIHCTAETARLVPIVRNGTPEDIVELKRQIGAKAWPFKSAEIQVGDEYSIIEITGQEAACMAIDEIISSFRKYETA